MNTPRKVLFVKTPSLVWNDLALMFHKRYNWIPSIFVGVNGESRYTIEIKKLFPEVEFLSHRDGLSGGFCCGIKERDLVPIDAELLERYSGVFSRLYEVGRRYFVGHVSHAAYYDYCTRIIRFYTTLVRKGIFNLVLCNSIPHRFYDNVIYEVAKQESVPFVTYDFVPNGDLNTHYAISDLENRSQPIAETVPVLKSLTPHPRVEEAIRIGRQNSAASQPKHFQEKAEAESRMGYWGRLSKKSPLELRLLWQLGKLTLKGQAFNTGSRVRLATQRPSGCASLVNMAQQSCFWYANAKLNHAAHAWYNAHTEQPDYSTPFVYFSANRQPERSTAPDAGRFGDLRLICEVLNHSVPSSWNIYFKEHPTNFRHGFLENGQRSVEYYTSLQKIAPRVKFIPYAMPSYALLEYASVIATAQGSIVWEGALRGIPSVVFADSWLNQLHGVYYVDSVGQAKRAFARIEAGGVPDDEEVKSYASALIKCGVQDSVLRMKGVEKLKDQSPDYYYEKVGELVDVGYAEFCRRITLQNGEKTRGPNAS